MSESTYQQRVDWGPWLWGTRTDLWAFAGSAGVALSLVGLGHALGFGGGALPEWGWVLFVLLIDVAHVYATLFRTYLDGDELRRHPLRYVGAPIFLYFAGVTLYQRDPMIFWRVAAYVAVFHFARQQVGWVALYRVRAAREAKTHGSSKLETLSLSERWIDNLTVYSFTGFPILYWHAHLDERAFHWFLPGDFVSVGTQLTRLLPWFGFVTLLVLTLYVVRQVHVFLQCRRVDVGKNLVVFSTGLLWNVGIVFTNSDFDFTVTNVIAHGVPYMVLLWSYHRVRQRSGDGLGKAPALGASIAAFLGLLFALACVEEWLWHALVWPDHASLFGSFVLAPPPSLLSWVVPLLALPQLTHYALDGVLWRRRDTQSNPAQQLALGFAP